MLLLRIPRRLKIASWVPVLGGPLAALQVVLHYRAPWWNLPHIYMALLGGVVALGCLILGQFASRGRAWGFWGLLIFALSWVSWSVYESIMGSHFWLGIHTLGLSAFWVISLQWIHFELSRSFYDPQMFWYQGTPTPIPGVQCTLKGVSGEDSDFRVCRLEWDGAFLYGGQGYGFLSKDSSVEMEFSYRGWKTSCRGMPVRAFGDRTGLGVKFYGNSLDAQKELQDFVERIRGAGH